MKKLFTFLFCITLSMYSFGQLAGWDFDPLTGGTNNFGPSPYSPTTTSPNITVVGLTRGSGVGTTGSGAANAWGGNAWDEGTDLATAIAAGNFATYQLTPNPGFTMSLSNIGSYNVRRSGTGPTTGQWQYQVGSGAFTTIGSPITWGTATNSAGNTQSLIDLSGIPSLQNVAPGTTITFRVVNWGAGSAGGTWYLNDPASPTGGAPGDDFTVNGVEAPLPVELVYVDASIKNEIVKIKWETASEIDNSHFVIEKSTDGRNFREIGTVMGNGTSYQLNNYTFTDDAPAKGINYYRLKQVDFDGRFEYSKVVSVRFGRGEEQMLLYPTLAAEEIQLRFPNSTEVEGTIQFFDQVGHLAKTLAFESDIFELQIPISELASGHYFVKIQNGLVIETLRFTKR